MGIMKKKMETTTMGHIGITGTTGVVLGEWKRKWKLL